MEAQTVVCALRALVSSVTSGPGRGQGARCCRWCGATHSQHRCSPRMLPSAQRGGAFHVVTVVALLALTPHLALASCTQHPASTQRPPFFVHCLRYLALGLIAQAAPILFACLRSARVGYCRLHDLFLVYDLRPPHHSLTPRPRLLELLSFCHSGSPAEC